MSHEPLEWPNFKTLAEKMLAEAKKKGATQAEVHVSGERALSTTVRMQEVDTVQFSHDKSLSLTLYNNQQKGSVSTSDFSEAALNTLIDAAWNIASFAESDPFSGLADKKLLAETLPDLDLYHPWDLDPPQAIDWAKKCEKVALAVDPRVHNSEGASFSTHIYYQVYANSHGFMGDYKCSRHGLSCSVVGQSGEGVMQRDFDFTTARDVQDLENYEKVGKSAAERTLRRLNARKIKTCVAPVLFSAEIAGTFFSNLIAAISGGNLYRQASFLVDHLDKPLFPRFIQIEEDPLLLKALGSTPFDQEGVALKRHDIIKDGILKSYVLSSYSARKLGLQTTGNSGGIHNLLVSHNNLSREALIQKMNRGLIVMEFLGQGTNLVTGDYSRGVAGFWVENGEIQFPVEEITIASNLKDMFANIVAISNDTEKRHVIQTGSILIESMTIAGN